MVTNARLMTEGYVGTLDDKQQELMRRMISSGEHLLTLIRDYLDLARLESQELRLLARPDVDFEHQVVRPALDTIRTPLEAKRMSLAESLPSPMPRVEVDPDLCKIVLINLLSNAVKYGNEDGEVRLRVVREADALQVWVWNEGPGFTEAERMRLFRKFSRLPSAKLRNEKGTGVGLYTVSRIVNLHRGRVWAKSEPDAWAEFAFEIPQPLPVANNNPYTTTAAV
jgi:signal transduction histidine kinase